MNPYRRALDDPAFLSAVDERWTGRVPTLEALRGLDDEEEGSPYAGLDARRAALYRPGADPAEVAEVARLIRERDELRAVVAAVLEDAGAGAAPVAIGPRASVRPPRRAWPVLLLAVPAAAAAFAGGLLLGPALGSRAEVLPTVAPAQLPAPVVVRPAGADALAIFTRTRHITDRPIVAPEGDLVATSFRRLVTLQGAGVDLYAARTGGDQVCLVAVTVDAHLTAACADPEDFRAMPLTIDLSVTKDPSTDDPKDTRTEVEATWSSDGTVRAGAVS
ncbi:MAG TPA: hypothetical protein VIG76_00900 [Amnibacterium sp.]|jgi:hypothetical protein|uniref:hypothetical protein n=1 Tax=Amnibacterium sp. TaxID=1872496 RepID=UPI002F9468E8